MVATQSRLLALSGSLALGSLFAGCGSSGGGGGILFDVVNTKQAAGPSARIVISERWLVYQADESATGPAGTDFNQDGDVIDSIACLVNMANKKATVLNVAAQDMAVLGGEIFLVTSEAADGQDWNSDADQADLVLLTVDGQTATPAGVTFVAELRSSAALLVAVTSGRLYFSEQPAAGDPLVAPETSIAYVTASAPTAPVRVLNADAANTLQAKLLALDEDLLFAVQEEAIEGRDLNGDGDQLDGFVLGLIDGSVAAAPLRNTSKALAGPNSPVRAMKRAVGDWVVGFLVDEAAQGGTNLNNPAAFGPSWQPPQCVGAADSDAADQVLGYLEFADWVANPVTNPPVNTGLVGTQRVLAVRSNQKDYVATISLESDEGTCSLNGDTDQSDRVLRWVEVTPPTVLPFTNVAHLVALDDNPGGTRGVGVLGSRFVAVVDEAQDDRDHDGNAAVDFDLTAWIDAAQGNAAQWTYDHNGAGTQGGFVGSSWSAETGDHTRWLVGFQESVFDQSVNTGGDTDKLDSAPTIARFDSGNANDLDFPGAAIAVDADNAGITIANGIAFFRVDEASDNRDWNGGGKTHFVLFRTTAGTLQQTTYIATLNSLARPAVDSGGTVGAAFLSDESADNKDLNKDGDKNDFVVRWFRIGS
jgi:hypothetical protein